MISKLQRSRQFLRNLRKLSPQSIKFIIRKEENAYFLIAIGKHDIYRRS